MELDYIISNFFANNHGNYFLNHLMLFFSQIADKAFIFIALALILLTFKKTRKLAFGIAICLLMVQFINNMFLKEIIARPRPFQTYPELLPNVLGVPPTSKSFPSGHTMCSFGVATYFWCYRKKYLKTSIGLSFAAFLIGFSRIYVIHHYFFDVIGGMFIGILFGIISYFIIEAIYKKIDSRKRRLKL